MGDDAFPRALGPYLLLGRVGRGGMGDVYLARHGLLLGFEKYCVLKTLRDDRADDAGLLARFADEARVVVQLAHRNICPVFDVGRVGAKLYVALEHVVGCDLRTLADAGPVPVPIALHIVGEVLEALDYAHHFVDVKSGAPLGIVHRDVSPPNVLLGVDGDTKLIDFGIATRVHRDKGASKTSRSDEVMGKLSYMSPEHACGEDVDGRSDQFAAAIVLGELLLGARFHEGLSTLQMWETAGLGTHRPARWSTIEASLRAILDQALAPAAAQRFASCAAFGDALSDWARAHHQVAAPRDLRRHLRATFGDLAAAHRATMRTLDAVTLPPPAVLPPGSAHPGDDPGEGQFESIATTLALPSHTPAFGNAAATLVLPPHTRSATAVAPAPTSRSLARGSLGVAGLVVGLVVGATLATLAAPWFDARAPAVVAVAARDAGTAAAVAVVEADRAGGDDTAALAPVPLAIEAIEEPAASTPPAAARPRRGFDADTTRDIDYLRRSCVGKVPCTAGVLEWSRRSPLGDADRAQLKESARDCAKRCRLR